MVLFVNSFSSLIERAHLRTHTILSVPESSMATVTGYTGLFRLPTTEVIGDGKMGFGFGAGPLVREVTIQPVSANSSAYATTLGFLPGLEVGLSFLTPAPFNGILSDRTVSAKYAVKMPSQSGYSFAFGSTDVQGTRRRAADYVVAGRKFGALSTYAGLSRGYFAGGMFGVSWAPTSKLAIQAEQTGSVAIAGLRAQPIKNWSLSAGVDNHGRALMGTQFAIGLGGDSHQAVQTNAATEEDLSKALAEIAHGKASAVITQKELVADYDDVEARTPMPTLSAALRACVESALPIKNLRLTVWRMGIPMVTISGPVDAIRSYLQGFSSREDFLHAVEITPGSSDNGEPKGHSPSTLVTLAPGISYRLGTQDSLPNSEWIQARTVTRLPLGFIAASVAETNVNNSFGQSGNPPSASYGLYKAAQFRDVSFLAGLERTPELDGSGKFEVAYRPLGTPLSLFAGYRRSFQNDKVRHYVQLGYDLTSSLNLWARNERFQEGDLGTSVGATRRFGELRVTLQALRTSNSNESLKQVGVLFQLPLPNYSRDFGGARIGTARYAEFSYRPTIHAEPVHGLADPPKVVFSLADQIQARGELSAQYVRNSIERLRYK